MRKLLLLVPLVVLSIASGCGDAMGPDSSELGVYRLASINDSAPPTPFFSVEVLSGSLTLKEGSAYTTESTVRARDNLGQTVTQTQVENGTYTRAGATLRFTRSDGVETSASYDGRSITVRASSNVIVWRRR